MSEHPERSLSSRLESLEGPRRPQSDIAERMWNRIETALSSAPDEDTCIDDLGLQRVSAALHTGRGARSRRRRPMRLIAAALVVLAGLAGIVAAQRGGDPVDRVATAPPEPVAPTTITDSGRVCRSHDLPALIDQIAAAATGASDPDLAARLDALAIAVDEMAQVLARAEGAQPADSAETWLVAGRLTRLAAAQLDAGDLEAAALSAEALSQSANLGLRRLDDAGIEDCRPMEEEP